MSDSVWPHPWDSPGKNTGVGCHFLLQCIKLKSESEVTQSCLTLHDPLDCSLPGSSVHGIFQARLLEWGAIAFFSDTNVYRKQNIFSKMSGLHIPQILKVRIKCYKDIVIKSLSHVWLLATSWMQAHQTPLSMGFHRQEYWSGLPYPLLVDLPNPGLNPHFLLGRRILYNWATRKAHIRMC